MTAICQSKCFPTPVLVTIFQKVWAETNIFRNGPFVMSQSNMPDHSPNQIVFASFQTCGGSNRASVLAGSCKQRTKCDVFFVTCSQIINGVKLLHWFYFIVSTAPCAKRKHRGVFLCWKWFLQPWNLQSVQCVNGSPNITVSTVIKPPAAPSLGFSA